MLQLPTWNQFAFEWFLAIANFTVVGSLFLTGTLIFSVVAAKYSASLKFLVVLSGLCGLTALPLLSNIGGFVQNRPMIQVENVSEKTFDDEAEMIVPETEVPELQTPAVNAPPKREIISVYGWLFLGWLLGVGIRGVVTLLGLVGMYRSLGCTLPLENVTGKELFGIKLRLAEHPAFALPVTCGLFRPTILVPPGFVQGPVEQQQAIICHEAAHIRRWDNLTNLLAQLIVAVYWFNPLAWLALAQLRILREEACDDYVLCTGIKPSSYAQVLLGALQKGWKARDPVLMSNFNSKGANRLKYILDSKVDHRLVSGWKKVLFVAGLGLILLPLAGLRLLAAEETPSRQEIGFKSWQERPESIVPILQERKAAITRAMAVAPRPAALPEQAVKSEPSVLPNRSEELPGIVEQQEACDSLKGEIEEWQTNYDGALGAGEYMVPLRGRIAMRFGYRYHPVLQKVRYHNGYDIAAPHGTEIVATDSGEVIYSGPKGGYGLVVLINHGGGLSTAYAHASELLVTAGQKIAKGERIALVGSTGMSTGPHLHFEVRKDGVPQDPAGLIPEWLSGWGKKNHFQDEQPIH